MKWTDSKHLENFTCCAVLFFFFVANVMACRLGECFLSGVDNIFLHLVLNTQDFMPVTHLEFPGCSPLLLCVILVFVSVLAHLN